MKNTKQQVLIFSSLFLFVCITSAFFGGKSQNLTSNDSLWMELSAKQASEVRVNLPSLAPLVKRVEAAVLVVSTESVRKAERMQMPPGFEQSPFGDMFKFFGPPNGQMPDQKTKGQGSGFIIHPSGLALTNNHVIEGATSIKIKIGEALEEYEAEVIGADAATDVALIKIKSKRKDWPVIPLGSSTEIGVGDFAVAIGNPLGLELSVSLGIVSARGRRDIHPAGSNALFDFIQIDAPINPGNSGGPLLNLSGEAIGINTAISSAGQGIAFAIPIDQVKQILPQLKTNGKAARSGMGIRIENVSPELAKAFGFAYPYGAVVREVLPGSAAYKAGVIAGDVVTKFNGKIVKDASSLQVMAGLSGVGKSVPVSVYRDGKNIMLKMTLEEIVAEKPKNEIPVPQNEKTSGIDSIGLSVVTLDSVAREHLNLDKNILGARVIQVQPRSIAQMAGIEPDDVIVKVNNFQIKSGKSLSDIIEKTKAGEVLRILLKRKQATIFIAITKP